MNGAGSESNADVQVRAREPLTEVEDEATSMTYGEGRMPWVVALVWVCALVLLTWYYVAYGVPDLRDWLRG